MASICKNLFGVMILVLSVSSVAVAHTGYDYLPAMMCKLVDKNWKVTQIEKLRTEVDGGVWVEGTGAKVYVICPIPRTYPRSPGLIDRVAIKVKNQDKLDFIVTASSAGRNNMITKKIQFAASNKVTQHQLNASFLESIRSVPYGWDYFMSITISLRAGDFFQGYIVHWNPSN